METGSSAALLYRDADLRSLCRQLAQFAITVTALPQGRNLSNVYQIAKLVDAGYAVLALDLEGLGPVATQPYPYFSEVSLARSVIAGVLAAREAVPQLSTRWAVVGHSDGGYAALAVEAHANEAPGFAFLGTVALAPYNSVASTAVLAGNQADAAKNTAAKIPARVSQNSQVALMTAGLMTS